MEIVFEKSSFNIEFVTSFKISPGIFLFFFFPFVKCDSIDMNSRQTIGRTILVVFKIREIFFKSNNFR